MENDDYIWLELLADLDIKYLTNKPDYISAKDWYVFWLDPSADPISDALGLSLEHRYIRKKTEQGLIMRGSEAFTDPYIYLAKAIQQNNTELINYFLAKLDTLVARQIGFRTNLVEVILPYSQSEQDVTTLLKLAEQGFSNYPDQTLKQQEYDKLAFEIAFGNIPLNSTLLDIINNNANKYLEGLIASHNILADKMISRVRVDDNEIKNQLHQHYLMQMIFTAIKYNNMAAYQLLIPLIPTSTFLISIIAKWLTGYNQMTVLQRLYIDRNIDKPLPRPSQIYASMIEYDNVDEALQYASDVKGNLKAFDKIFTCDPRVIQGINDQHKIHLKVSACTDSSHFEKALKLLKKPNYNDYLIQAVELGNHDIVTILIDKVSFYSLFEAITIAAAKYAADIFAFLYVKLIKEKITPLQIYRKLIEQKTINPLFRPFINPLTLQTNLETRSVVDLFMIPYI